MLTETGSGDGRIAERGHAGQGGHTGPPLQRVLQWFKTMTTNVYIHGVKHEGWEPFPGTLWQRSYFDRIIRNEKESLAIHEYILDNPRRWEQDTENPAGRGAV